MKLTRNRKHFKNLKAVCLKIQRLDCRSRSIYIHIHKIYYEIKIIFFGDKIKNEKNASTFLAYNRGSSNQKSENQQS